jgi:hypothetical protein
VGLAVALAAAVALLAGALPAEQAPPGPAVVARPGPAQAWPGAARADLRDLGLEPLLFLDATTPVGTVDDDREIRLFVKDREIRSRPAETRFDNLTRSGNDLLWTETGPDGGTEIWTVRPLAPNDTPRRLTADTGNILLYGGQHDLVVADGRVHWAAADGDRATEIRSVALTGGPAAGGEEAGDGKEAGHGEETGDGKDAGDGKEAGDGEVAVRTEPGQWALAAWPFLTSDVGGQAGEIRLRDLETGREQRITAGPAEWTMCTPAWCRVMVNSAEGLARIDVMRPDGSGRRRIAGPGTQAAVNDVAVLDRFEILSEPRPDSDLTGTSGLVVHDIETGRTVTLSAAAGQAASRDGMLWWSTGDREARVWHTLDLRTIQRPPGASSDRPRAGR